MYDNTWAYDLGKQIYSVIRVNVKQRLSSLYNNLNITNKSKSVGTPQFPTIYIHELPGTEVGQDLEGTSINGIMITFQVEVTTNEDEAEIRKIMGVVADEFKRMHFQTVSLLDIDDSGEVIRGIARFRRIKGNAEPLY